MTASQNKLVVYRIEEPERWNYVLGSRVWERALRRRRWQAGHNKNARTGSPNPKEPA